MPKHSASQHVPKELQARFDELAQLTDEFSEAYLNAEYAQLCREVIATLARKRPSPLLAGKTPTWVAGIIHAVGVVNFLSDRSQSPHPPPRQPVATSAADPLSQHSERARPRWTRPLRLREE